MNQPPKPRPTIRSNAFDVIDGERDYQDANHPGPRTLIDDANLLIEFTDKLAAAVTVESPSPAGSPQEILREIASIATRAMEDHGVVPRANHVPPSAGITGVVKVVGKGDAVGPAPKKPTVIVDPPKPAAAPAHAPQPAHHTPEPIAQHTTEHGKK